MTRAWGAWRERRPEGRTGMGLPAENRLMEAVCLYDDLLLDLPLCLLVRVRALTALRAVQTHRVPLAHRHQCRT